MTTGFDSHDQGLSQKFKPDDAWVDDSRYAESA